MIQFKKEIAKEISKATEIEQNEIEGYIEIPKDQNNGDYAFPCFRLAKTLKKAPQAIAEEIKEKIEIDNNIIEKIEVLGGYINFYINKRLLAKEVLEGMPCALNIHTESNIESVGAIFPNFMKIYFNNDIIGGEVAGAYKNIIAIAGGINDGLNLANNAKASILARGLVEMCRFGMYFGAKESTFIGLSGAGDLFLTANSLLSRNYRVGNALAKNKPLKNILDELGEIAEGVLSTQAVVKLATKHNIYTPIANQVYQIINGKSPRDSARELIGNNFEF